MRTDFKFQLFKLKCKIFRKGRRKIGPARKTKILWRHIYKIPTTILFAKEKILTFKVCLHNEREYSRLMASYHSLVDTKFVRRYLRENICSIVCWTWAWPWPIEWKYWLLIMFNKSISLAVLRFSVHSRETSSTSPNYQMTQEILQGETLTLGKNNAYRKWCSIMILIPSYT